MNPAGSTIKGFTQEETFILKWQLDCLGGFGKAFASAAIVADEDNLDRLAKGFPIEIGAIRRFWSEVGWWESLEHRAAAVGIHR